MRRAEEICRGVNVLYDETLALAEAVVLMAEKIEASIKTLENEPLVIPYNNGGGQEGIRENPQYTAFEKLMATYIKSLRQLEEAVEKGSSTQSASGIMKELKVIAGKKVG